MKFLNLKRIRLRPLITHLIVSLGYPTVKAFTVTSNRLLAFADSVTIIGLFLLVIGIIYSMNLHGDFDISRYYLRRGLRSFRMFAPPPVEAMKEKQNPAEFLDECRKKRENAFNYPLFLGIVYVLVSVVIVYGFLR
ncbi:MAG: DUF3899 domain-containing protein [Firmicutes bacterium]|nr:DUF3899 domain-containing protein [Bacillota bacterium]